jgi:hypothetical protein
VYNKKQEEKLKVIADAAAKDFSPESKPWWPNIKELKRRVDVFSQSIGCAIEQRGSSLRCSLAHQSQKKTEYLLQRQMANGVSPSRTRKRKDNRCGCQFIIKYTL